MTHSTIDNEITDDMTYPHEIIFSRAVNDWHILSKEFMNEYKIEVSYYY